MTTSLRLRHQLLGWNASSVSSVSSLAATLALIFLVVPVFPQQRAERTIDEIKTEAIHRAEVGQYPLIGVDPGDIKEAFNSIHTRDKDEWAAAFMGVADRYMNEAKSLEKTDPTKRTLITSARGGFILSDAGPSPHLPANSAPTKKRSRLSWHMPASGIRRSKS